MKTLSQFLTETKNYLQEAKLSEANLEKAVNLFVSLFEKKIGTKLYRFGGPKGYTEIKNGIGILFFYDVKKAIRFNYSAGSLDSITLWDSYKLGEKGDRTISFEELNLMQAARTLIDIISKNIKSGTITVIPEETKIKSRPGSYLSEAKRITPLYAAELIIQKLSNYPGGFKSDSVPMYAIKEILYDAGFQVPIEIRNYKGIRGRFNLDAIKADPNTAKPSVGNEPEYPVSVSSGDSISSNTVSINQDITANTLSNAVETGILNPNIKQEMDDPESLFGIMRNLVQVVCRKSRNSLIIYGGPGTGKTFTVLQTVKDEGLVKNDDFFIVKGKITTSELYRTLFMHREGKLLIFDDTDSVWADKDAANILKAALDSYEERTVSWFSPRTFNVSKLTDDEKDAYNEELDLQIGDPESRMKFPSEFLYNGRIIFISNLSYDKFDSAVLTRAAKIDMTLTDKQMFKRMEGILDHLGDKSVPKAVKREILEFLRQENTSGKLQGVSMRTFVAASDLYKSGLPNWKDLLGYI